MQQLQTEMFRCRMQSLFVTGLLVVLLTSRRTYGDERCYDEAGCISLEEILPNPIYRVGASYPENRAAVNVTFYYHTRRNRYDSYNFSWSSTEEGLRRVDYDASKSTKFIVHGFRSGADAKWVEDMKNAYLNAADYNVILVSWDTALKYRQAVVHVHLAGGELAAFLRKLQKAHGVRYEDVHIVGHSLGAHVAGRAGYMLQNYTSYAPARITGLDPAGPLFEDQEPIVRLDPTDARFVDVIHTDASALVSLKAAGLGLKQEVGHIDFYPNGGEFMPGCGLGENIKAFIDSIISDEEMKDVDLITCNHVRAQAYMTESIENRECLFMGFECESYEKFQRGECSDCGEDGSKCAPMGEPADRWTGQRDPNKKHRMYLDTAAEPPYCMFRYRVTIKRYPDDGKAVNVNQLNLTVQGSKGKEVLRAVDKRIKLELGSRRTFLVRTSKDLGKIKSVRLRADSNWPLSFKYIEIQPMSAVKGGKATRYRLPKSMVAAIPFMEIGLKAWRTNSKKIPCQ